MVRGVLSSEELVQATSSISSLEGGEQLDATTASLLTEHPNVTRVLQKLLGQGYYLDEAPVLQHQINSDADQPLLSAGPMDTTHTASGVPNSGVGMCNGVRVVFALADADQSDGGWCCVPATHKCFVPTPHGVRNREDVGIGPRGGLTAKPALQAGDMLVHAQTLVHGMETWKAEHRQMLVDASFNVRVAKSSSGQRTGAKYALDEDSQWWANLDDATKAVVGVEHLEVDATVLSDGDHVWEGPKIYHPEMFAANPDPLVDPLEHWMWDCHGYLIVRNVMDPEWIDACNHAIDRHAADWEEEVESGMHHPSPKQAGTPRLYLNNLFKLPKPDCDPFHKMIAHPAVVQRLNWIMGAGFHIAGGGSAITFPAGTEGIRLHGNGKPLTNAYGATAGGGTLNSYGSYAGRNGRHYTACVNVTWCLTDVGPEDGGYVVIPGSHKAQDPLPLTDAGSPQTADMNVILPPVNAGDLIFFMAGTTTHAAWTQIKDRRIVIPKYYARDIDLSRL